MNKPDNTKELMIASQELASQIEENEKRAEELIIATKELAFQIEEKEKRAKELIIANIELAFQIREKEKRAEELVVANSALALQMREKDKWAEELVVANRELKIIEKNLNQTNSELEAFSYSVSHDLRAPLRAISGFSAVLKEDYEAKLDKEGNRVIDVIIKNAGMMGMLIDDLLTFSRLSKFDAVPEFIGMQDLVKNSFDELVQTENQIKYAFTILPMPECCGDASMLKQVWFNLLSNAVKYSSKKTYPAIEAGATDNGNTIVYYVKDNGAGFDMKYYNKLFGVFERLHLQDEFAGTGVGLALAKRIVSKHGGEIWAESILNEGATFYFSIPKI